MIFVRAKRSLLLGVVIVLMAGCARGVLTQTPAATRDAAQYWPTAGWRSSTPEVQGMDSDLLGEMLATIQEQNYEIDSVTIVRNGYLVVDASIHPFSSTSKHNIFSCTKSVVSALVGIAIDQGTIDGLQQPVLSIFPQRTVANRDANKDAMTLEHLLSMTTGFRCQDSYLYRWSGLNQMGESEDWVQFVLDLPMEGEPGERFEYCNGASFLLSAIIQETTGMSAIEFAQEHLFGPLGISDVEWSSNPQGISIGYSELRMHPHDMAKIGYLYLNEGRWDEEQIVSSAWVKASTRKYISATLEDGYGYQWWIDDSGMYLALGYGGQFIFILPEKEMVVVFTSSLEESDFYIPQTLLNEFIIPAATASSTLPDNPEGSARLESLLEELASP
ncbi:MAG: beta-lactamase family protein [Anaerolineales bacterium]|nr:beta-lactamase family protein [Anaerolineales bacterium]